MAAKPLTAEERKHMAEMYKEAGIKPISKKPLRKFNKYRNEWAGKK